MQSRAQSFIEACTNIACGYLLALLTQVIVFPLYGMTVSLGSNLQLGVIFTAVSLIRSFVLRRAFNRVQEWRGA